MSAQTSTLQPADRPVDAGAALRRRTEVLHAAITRAHDQRAAAFRETIGALWRFASRPKEIGASGGLHGGACPST